MNIRSQIENREHHNTHELWLSDRLVALMGTYPINMQINGEWSFSGHTFTYMCVYSNDKCSPRSPTIRDACEWLQFDSNLFWLSLRIWMPHRPQLHMQVSRVEDGGVHVDKQQLLREIARTWCKIDVNESRLWHKPLETQAHTHNHKHRELGISVKVQRPLSSFIVLKFIGFVGAGSDAASDDRHYHRVLVF